MTAVARRRLVASIALLTLIAVPGAMLARARPFGATPPPTPVPPDGSLSPFPTVLHTPANPTPAPVIAAPAAILADLETGVIVAGDGADVRRPIASLTKVMTALLVLERTDPGDVVTVAPQAVFGPDDFGAGATLGLRAGERARVEDLLYALLLGSANDAAEALAIHVSGSTAAFVREMNERAEQLGMTRTEFASVHGLDDDGMSTPRDVLRLVLAARAQPAFRTIVAARFHRVPAREGPDRRVQNRNAMLWLFPGATGVKTGSTVGAGACLVATAERGDRGLIAVVLGARTEAFSDAAALLDHGFAAYAPAVVVRAGQAVGTVAIDGRRVPVTAAGQVEGLVRVGVAPTIELVPDPDAAFPPVPGDRVGELRVLGEGRPIGTTVLVAGTPPAPRPVEGPWWLRALGAMGRAAVDAVDGLAA